MRKRVSSVAALAVPVVLGFAGTKPLRIYPGPADPAYSVDLPARYRVAEPAFFRWTGRASGFDLPWTLLRPAMLRVHYTLGRDTTPLTLALDGEEIGRVALVEGEGEVRFVLPAGKRLRLRFSGEPDSPDTEDRLRVSFWGIEIASPAGGRLPSLTLFSSALALPWVILAFLVLAGMKWRDAFLLALFVSIAECLLIRGDPYAMTRLFERLLVPTLLVGGAALAVFHLRHLRHLRHVSGLRDRSPFLLGAFLVALLLRLGIVLHPSAYHYDHAAHVGLVRFLVEKGLLEFWRQKAELQTALNVGELVLAGQKLAFPYPTLFYVLAAPLARVLGSIDLAVMTLAGVLAALEVFLVAAVARALTLSDRASLYAAFVAALYPASYGILTIALYPSLAAHVAELAVVLLFARDVVLERPVRLAPWPPKPWRRGLAVAGIVLASSTHVSALINLALFAVVLAAVSKRKDILVAGGLGVLASLLVSYRSAVSLVGPTLAHLGDQSFSRYWLQLEPPQSFSFMGGFLWPAVGLVGFVFLGRTKAFPFMVAWGLSFLALRILRVALGPAGAHLKELQWVAPLVCLGVAHALDVSAKGRRALVAPAALTLFAAVALLWVSTHEKWLLPIRTFSD